jgi:hypothetical protein
MRGIAQIVFPFRPSPRECVEWKVSVRDCTPCRWPPLIFRYANAELDRKGSRRKSSPTGAV